MAFSLPVVSAADFQKTWDDAAGRRITIFTPHGDIKLIGYDGKNIDISAVKKGPDHERVRIEDISIGNHINIFSRYLDPARNNATVDFEIRVPNEIFYNIEPMSKPPDGRGMYFQGFPGGTPTPSSQDASASPKPSIPSDVSPSPKPSPTPDASALPKLPPPPGASTFPKIFPPVGAMQFPHAIFLKSNSGRISISDVAGSMRVEGRSIEIYNVDGMLYASSGSGEIKGTLKKTSRSGVLRLSSSSGNISLQAPDDIGALVHIQSTTGQVKTDFPLVTNEMRYGGKFIEGRLGEGNQILDIRSVSGAITFFKKTPETKDK